MGKTSDTDLNDKQRLFVQYYLQTLNAAQAAIRAGYSKRSANTDGPRMLRNAAIRKAISEQLDEALGNEKLTLKYRIVKGYTQIAFGKKSANADRIKALDALAKYVELWSDSVPQTINFNVFAKELISEGQ